MMNKKQVKTTARKMAVADERKMLSIDEIKHEFEQEGETFTDAELEKIRDYLYLLVQISYEHYQRNKRLKEQEANNKIINLKNYQDDESTKSHSIHPCEYGRTG